MSANDLKDASRNFRILSGYSKNEVLIVFCTQISSEKLRLDSISFDGTAIPDEAACRPSKSEQTNHGI